jgi:hypothetical protein
MEFVDPNNGARYQFWLERFGPNTYLKVTVCWVDGSTGKTWFCIGNNQIQWRNEGIGFLSTAAREAAQRFVKNRAFA